MVIELIGGPSDGLLMDCHADPPVSFVMPVQCQNLGHMYVSECRCSCHEVEHILRYFFAGSYPLSLADA
jgi:hypothetical protein